MVRLRIRPQTLTHLELLILRYNQEKTFKVVQFIEACYYDQQFSQISQQDRTSWTPLYLNAAVSPSHTTPGRFRGSPHQSRFRKEARGPIKPPPTNRNHTKLANHGSLHFTYQTTSNSLHQNVVPKRHTKNHTKSRTKTSTQKLNKTVTFGLH